MSNVAVTVISPVKPLTTNGFVLLVVVVVFPLFSYCATKPSLTRLYTSLVFNPEPFPKSMLLL